MLLTGIPEINAAASARPGASRTSSSPSAADRPHPSGRTDVANVDASREAIKSFAGALQEQPKSAMAARGPTAAIEVCNIAAPETAAEASDEHGWRIGRTSPKLRNPAKAPIRESRPLREFEARNTAGERLATLDRADIVVSGGQRTFRYMKAIGTQPVCTICHSAAIAPDVTAALDALYPDDRARGFEVGDIRAASSIAQPVPQDRSTFLLGVVPDTLTACLGQSPRG